MFLLKQTSWNLFSAVSHLDCLPSEVCQSRRISISPKFLIERWKNYIWILLSIYFILNLHLHLIPPNLHFLDPHVHILIYHFINFHFFPSHYQLSSCSLFLILFFSFCTHHATETWLSDSGVLIMCSRRHKWLKLV